MDTKILDIVYLLREGDNPELVYSIRSVEQNFPHNRIVFVGGCPKGLVPDIWIPTSQEQGKWQNASDSLRLVCESEDLSEDIVLFNDDFFILNPVGLYPTYVNHTLPMLCRLVTKGWTRRSEYIEKRILPALGALKRKNLSVLNYELHVPMIINRAKMLKIYEMFPGVPAKRSLYGNFYKVHGEEIAVSGMWDGVVQSLDSLPKGRTLVSTTDESWQGRIGEWLKQKFPDKSKYEKLVLE